MLTITSLKKVKIDGVTYNEHPYTNSNVVEVVYPVGDAPEGSLTEELVSIRDDLDLKVAKVAGKGLSTNDFTNTLKNKLDILDMTSDLNKPISTATQTALDTKVNKDGSKVLSTNDYSTTEKNKLAGIATGAQVNPAVASKADAEAGSDTVKMMTPERTKEAILKLAPVASSSTPGIVKISDTYVGNSQDTALSQSGANALKDDLEVKISVGAKPLESVLVAFSENVVFGTHNAKPSITEAQLATQGLSISRFSSVYKTRILFYNQNNRLENGIYILDSSITQPPLGFVIKKLTDDEQPIGSLVFVEEGLNNDRQYYYKGGTNYDWVLFARPDTLKAKSGGGLKISDLEVEIEPILKGYFDNPRQFNDTTDASLSYSLLVQALAYEIKKIKGTAKTFTVDDTKTLDNRQSKITYTTDASVNPTNNGDIVIWYTT